MITFFKRRNHTRKRRTNYESGHRYRLDTLEPRLLLSASPAGAVDEPAVVPTAIIAHQANTGMLSGQKFEDVDGNNQRDPGELGINGFQIALVDPVTGSTIDIATTTDVDLDGNGTIDPATERGIYQFTGLTGGEYIVREFQQAGFEQSFPLYGDIQFHLPMTGTTGSAPVASVHGDIDNDGDVDVIVANSFSDDITVLFNHGDGSFPLSLTLDVGSSPQAIALGDIDGDTLPDIVVANLLSDTVSVIRNLGIQRFAPALNFPVGQRPAAVAVADLDGDGRRDIITANRVSDDVSVLLNIVPTNFDIEFDPAINTITGDGPTDIAIGDVDDDGDADVVTVNSFSENITILSNANGVLTRTGSIQVDGVPQGLTLAYLDNDSDLDIAVVRSTQDEVAVYRNDGTGVFIDAGSFPTARTPLDVAAVDIDGDADLDLVTINEVSASVSVLLNNANNGTFSTHIEYAAAAQPSSLIVTDMNHDSMPEIVVTDQLTNSVVVLRNRTDGTFAAARDYATNAGADSIVSADFDGDGDADLAVANSRSNDLSIFANQSNGRFSPAVTTATGQGPVSLVVFDADGDNDPDLVTANSQSADLSLLLNDGTGDFPVSLPLGISANPSAVVVADFDHDNDLDLIAVLGSSDAIQFLTNNGAGVFVAGAILATGNNPVAVDTGDLDGDNDLDLIVVNEADDSVTVFLNDGTGTYTPGVARVVGTSPRDVHLIDIDADNDLDVVTANRDSNNLTVLLNDGTGLLISSLTLSPTAAQPVTVRSTDIDGDGDPDLVVTHDDLPSISVFINDGGDLDTIHSFTTGHTAADVAIADLNADGAVDLATGNGAADSVSVLISRTSQGVTPENAYRVTITDTEHKSNLDFGNGAHGSISGVKFDDLNADGVRQPHEPTIAGWTVYLDYNDNRVLDAGEPATVTEANGVYTFSELAPGAITVAEESVSGWIQSFPATAVHSVWLSSNQDLVNVNFGNYRRGTIEGQKIEDVNGNGRGEPGEFGLNGWTIQLLDPADQSVLQETQTADVDLNNDGTIDPLTERGYYAFTDLEPGRYLVREVPQIPFEQTFPLFGGGLQFGRNAPVSSAGAGPSSAGSNDLNGDGIPDLVITNGLSDDISVLLNIGDGSFHDAVTTSTGDRPRNAAIADFDGDTLLDIAVANADGVSILFNQGAGLFPIATNLSAPGIPSAVGAGDLDGDGDQDLIIANNDTNTISVRLNLGDGTFDNPIGVNVGDGPSGLDVADIDRDGDLDAVIVHARSEDLWILLNDGSGTLTALSPIAVGEVPSDVIAFDADGDTDLDIATSNSNSDDVSVVMNLGGGSFSPATHVRVGEGPLAIDAVDADGDGLIDLVTANQAASNVAVLINEGGGSFADAVNFASGESPTGVTPLDANGDGHVDLAVSNESSNEATILFNDGFGRFGNIIDYEAGDNVRDVILLDVDGDDDLDIAAVNTDTDEIAILLNDGNGTYFDLQMYPTLGDMPRALVSGDFDLDGDIDIAVANYAGDNVSIMLNSGTGTFVSATRVPVTDGPVAIDAGDLNGDGGFDLVVSNERNGRVSVLMNAGGGNFTPGTDLTIGLNSPRGLSLGDADNDGDLDLAVVNYQTADVRVFTNDATGNLAGSPSVSIITGATPSAVTWVDINGDGALDLVTSNSTDHEMSLILNANQTGTVRFFDATTLPAPGLLPWDVSSGDFDGDGDDEIVTANGQTRTVGILINDYPDVNSTHSETIGKLARSIAVGDVDNDRDLDIVTANGIFNNVSVLLNTTPQGVIPPSTYSVTITSGLQAVNRDFGNAAPGTIAGRKFEDLNNNGVEDLNEPGLEGWSMFADLNANGELDDGEPEAVTDINGNFVLAGLMPGVYTIREVPQDEFQQSAPTGGAHTVVVRSAQAVTGVDFGNFRLSSIAGQKFNDLNGNGVLDGGESGLTGWTIFIDTNQNGTPDTDEPLTLTDTSGQYMFESLAPGRYVISEVQRSNWHQSLPGPDTGGVYTLDLASAEERTNVDFGNVEFSDIDGVLFEDTNADGLFESTDPRINGWTVFLDEDGDQTLDPGEPFTTTNIFGAYTLEHLLPGTYDLMPVAVPGWLQSTPATPSFNITLTSGSLAQNNVFGLFRVSTIQGRKFEDLNANGEQDAGEPNLAGWTFFLDDNTNGVQDAGESVAVTDANGQFLFDNLVPGTYTVAEVEQAGWLRSVPTQNASEVVLGSNEHVSSVLFGNFLPAQVSGIKFSDDNANGELDSAEPGLAGWTIYADLDANGQLDAGEPTAVTQADGSYTLTEVPPRNGEVIIAEVLQQGYVQTFPADPRGHVLPAISGSSLTRVNFGNEPRPDLVARPASRGIAHVFIPGHKDVVLVSVTNEGADKATGLGLIDVYLSKDQTLDATDVLIGSRDNRRIILPAGGSQAYYIPVNPPVGTELGDYYVLTDVTANDQIIESDAGNNATAAAVQDRVAWAFGTIGDIRKRRLSPKVNGTPATFTLVGDGFAEAIPTDTGIDIVITGSNAKSRLMVLPDRASTATYRNIDITGSLAQINSPKLNLTGNITATGSIATIRLGDLTPAAGDSTQRTFSIGATPGANGLVLSLGNVDNVSFSAPTTGIRRLQTQSWTNTNGTPNDMTTQYLNQLLSKSDFDANLTLTGDAAQKRTLNRAIIKGSVTGGTWDITGNAGVIQTGPIAPSWSATVTGDVQSLDVRGDASGSVTANSIRTLGVRGRLHDATVTVNRGVAATRPERSVAAIGRLWVVDAMENTIVTSAGNITSVSVGAMRDSRIFAGVDSAITTLPTTAANFTTPATIRQFMNRNRANLATAFENSNVAASTIKLARIGGHIKTNNDGVPFGLAGTRVGHPRLLDRDDFVVRIL